MNKDTLEKWDRKIYEDFLVVYGKIVDIDEIRNFLLLNVKSKNYLISSMCAHELSNEFGI